MINLDNIEQEIDRFSELSHENNYHIEIDVESRSCNGAPQIYIKLNNEKYFEEKVQSNKTYSIDKFIENNSSCKIVLGMSGKTDNNTKLKNGKIVLDQYVKILDIRINKASLVKNHLYFYDYTKFNKSDSDEVLYNVDGLYFNGELILEIPTPIFPFLSNLRQEKIGKSLYGKTITSDQRQNLIKTVFT